MPSGRSATSLKHAKLGREGKSISSRNGDPYHGWEGGERKGPPLVGRDRRRQRRPEKEKEVRKRVAAGEDKGGSTHNQGLKPNSAGRPKKGTEQSITPFWFVE